MICLRRLVFLTLVASLSASLAHGADPPPFEDVGFIDHHNLRRLSPDEEALKSQVAEIKTNLDKAKELGITHYVLFSRGFESLVNYDFEMEGVGNVGAKAFPAGCEHRRNAALYGRYLREALRYGRAKGIRMVFHTNQFEFPGEIYEQFGDRMKGTARVCPGKEFVWQLFRGKIREFFLKFPECDGLQITADETQISALSCQCEGCGHMGIVARVDRLICEAASVCGELGKEVQARTWGRVGELEKERNPSRMLDDLPPGVIVSIKNTRGDFYLTEPTSHLIGFGDDRQVVEFDCWGEYAGWNNFPCYKGDVLAERMKHTAKKGVRRVAARLCWDPLTNYVFERPWGNEVNVHLYAKLARNPSRDPDDILREWIEKRFPRDARDAAFTLYKCSSDLQKVWMTYRGRNANDHSRVLYRSRSTFDRVHSKLKSMLSDDYRFPPGDLAKRRRAVDRALREAEGLVQDLGPNVPKEWKDALLRGAKTEWFVAHGITDEMELLRIGLDVRDGKPLPDLKGIEQRLASRAAEWRAYDSASFDMYYGVGPSRMLEEVKAMVGSGE